MADMDEVVERPREGGSEYSGDDTGRDSVNGKGGTRRRKRRNSGNSEGSVQGLPSNQDRQGNRMRKEGRGQGRGQQTDSQMNDPLSMQGDHRARFFEDYRKEAGEYDKEFMKKYDEDLNTTLIFAGLFSAVTSAFIIEVNSQLQPDPNDEAVALLRVLVYKIDNTTFGNDVPALPQWTGPPNMMVHVQAILFASLAVSLFSAFLAMLGKQWLNRYESTDMRGSAIERSQNRQRKLDGVVNWYFDHVMESLPLMLQGALLLLGCALSRYLWEINVAIASVVLAVTSLGLFFYVFVVVAGTVSESCPYQTPGAQIFRHILHYIFHNISHQIRTLFIKSSGFAQTSLSSHLLVGWRSRLKSPWYSMANITSSLSYFLLIPVGLVADICNIGLAMAQLLVARCMAARRRLISTPFPHMRSLDLDQEIITLDLRCISWMLQTSLNKDVHLSTLKHLANMTTLADFDPSLIADCFDAFVGCIKIGTNKRDMDIMQGFEQLAMMSALSLFGTISHLLVTNPTSGALKDIRRRYLGVFSTWADFSGHQFYHTMNAVHCLFTRSWERRSFQWSDYKPSPHEHTALAHNLVKVAWFKSRSTPQAKVPRWILRFTFHSLSLDPPPPTSVVADCLLIVAIDLGCDLSNTGTTSSDESMRVEQVSSLIIQKVMAMANARRLLGISRKHKAITTLLPYATWQQQGGQPDMLDAFLRAATTSNFKWYPPSRYTNLFPSKATPRAIILSSPHIPWYLLDEREDLVQRWAAVVSAAPYTEEFARNVVEALFWIASRKALLSHIPFNAWSWLTKRPSLPPVCGARFFGTYPDVFKTVQELNDIEVLKSYLILVWSEWDPLQDGGFDEMCVSIPKHFGRTEMGHHRADLIQRLDHILEQLDQGTGHLMQRNPHFREDSFGQMKDQYGKLKNILLEANVEAIARSRNTFMCTLPLPYP